MTTLINENELIIEQIRDIYCNATPSILRSLIEKHFIPTQEEKQKNAEIPTPVRLVDEMLEKVPEEFWKTPHKVLEPCCGKGNFVLGIFDKFYNGLSELYEDEIERCQVIITECLYYADITELNVFITTEILKCHVQSYCGVEYEDWGYETNSNVGNTLELEIKTKWGVEGFDAVIGNPPYNDDSGNKGKGHTLWTKFIEVSITKWLNPDGYLLFVNPSLWRQIEHPLLKIMKNKQILYLEIHNVEDGQKTFRCATRYDWYVLQNTNIYKETVIIDEEKQKHTINLLEWNFIPNMMFENIKKLINGGEKLDVNNYRSEYGADKKWVKKQKDEEYKYPVVYSINKKNELSLMYSSKNTNGMFNKTKFIFSNGAGFYCDNNGEYGLTQWAYCIYEKPENLINIENAFRSDKFNKIKKALLLDSSSYNIKVLKLFSRDFWKEFV